MKYLLIGDIHLSDRAPSACTDDYLEDLFVILEHTIKLESELNVDGVIWSGDVFHHKSANRTSHRTVQRAVDIVQRYRNLWIVPGNHDMAQDRFDSVLESQPLGVLLRAGARLLKGWEATGEHPIYGVPWEQEWTQESVTEALRQYQYGGTKWNIVRSLVIAHAPLYPPGLELEWENFPTQQWSKAQGHGYCFYGHVHEAHGIYQVGGVTYCNQGAITRGSLHESELNRAIAVSTWDPELGFQRVEVPHRPASEIFKLMEKREKEEKKADLSNFLSSVNEAQIEITSIEAIVEHLKSLDLPEDVVKTAVDLLELSK